MKVKATLLAALAMVVLMAAPVTLAATSDVRGDGPLRGFFSATSDVRALLLEWVERATGVSTAAPDPEPDDRVPPSGEPAEEGSPADGSPDLGPGMDPLG